MGNNSTYKRRPRRPLPSLGVAGERNARPKDVKKVRKLFWKRMAGEITQEKLEGEIVEIFSGQPEMFEERR